MPDLIRKLPDEVIGKIAAGEVVERPAAAVKELVENSLDAGASAVTVEIRDGGISYLRVTDNGSGIRADNIRMAFERHATSKITSAQDLNQVGTLGFRGEALASIAAVSRVTCTTRTASDATGLRIRNEGGKILAIEEAACAQGTSMVVKDLFYNVPVRLGFLKKPATEASYVADTVMRLILSRPDVSFRLISQGKTLYHAAGDGKLATAVFAIYGQEMLRSMREVKGNQGGVLISGFVGIGESGRGNRSHQSFFINGRCMRSALLSAALEEACRERVMIGKYPSCVLHLTMPYEAVDVNVHPNKLEVRFRDEQAVSEAVTTVVREALRDRDAFERPVPMPIAPETPALTAAVTRDREPVPVAVVRGGPSAPAPVSFEEAVPRAAIPTTLRQTPVPIRPAAPAQAPQPLPPPALPQEPVSFLQPERKPLRILGVLFKTYILVEYADHLLMIDQHAVHERLLFDRMMRESGTVQAGQELLIPQIVSVTQREQLVLQENRELLEGIGFALEPFGEQEISVRRIPMILGEPQTAAFLHEVLDQLSGEPRGFTLEKRRTLILQSACKHAVKGGETLSEEDIRSLVEQMLELHVTPTCPHGRPLVVAISHTELDKRFKRIQH
ncbi:MAG: DNA mismatch repair endonuclease MutL [Clostridia bacterium]|nr:DNA mismatch repair endonuclease MutL [Clostridia bacterium]